MPVEDYEAFATVVTQLRLNPPYQAAEVHRRSSDAATMAGAAPGSAALAEVLLLIGTWERIGIMASDLSAPQRRKFFRSTPVGLMWAALNPAIQALGGPEALAPEFKKLNDRYQTWLASPDGEMFRTANQQAVHAMFG